MEEVKDSVVWKDRKHHLWFPWSFTKYYIEDDRLMIKTFWKVYKHYTS